MLASAATAAAPVKLFESTMRSSISM